MSVRKPLHVLALTATAERARLVGRVLRKRYPDVVLHGPFASLDEAAAYEAPGRLHYAVVDHRLDDGYGIEYWWRAPRSLAAPIVVVDDDGRAEAYAKQSIFTLPATRLAADLPEVVRADTDDSPTVMIQASTARWCAIDLAGQRPVYRRRIIQLLESWTDDSAAAMPMPATVIAHFYVDEGRTWAASVSGNLNPCTHTLDELEATLRPEIWCRINDRQLVSAAGLAVDYPSDARRIELQVTSPLRNEVDPARREYVEQWLLGAADALFDPDDEEELEWGLR